jgi:glycerophosphoryl diester phosphodiesterase
MRRAASFAAFLAVAAATGALSVAGADPADFDLQSHRGARGETTEESLRAFAKSLKLGVSTLELDIVITKHGQPLVWHEPVIELIPWGSR